MPSHIYMRVGRYADAIKSNQKAVAADEAYLAQSHATGAVPDRVLSAQHPFSLGGRDGGGSKPACHRVGTEGGHTVDDRTLAELPPTAVFRVVPYWALARFGKWNEISRNLPHQGETRS